MKVTSGLKYFVLAGLVGLIAVFLIHHYIVTKTARPIKPTASVVVAEVDIAPGTALEGRLMKVATWPQDIIPSKAVSNSQELNGRVVQVHIDKGEPILLSKLAPEGTAAGLGGLLDPEKLAVTVKTDEVSGVAGFINPGDRVDVLVEMSKPGASGEHFSKIILQKLKVLSKGQIWEQSGEKKPKVVNTVTLEVSPEEAELLNLASFQGKIRLALRNQINQAYFPTSGVVTSQLAFREAAAAKVAATVVQPAKAREKYSALVIRGMDAKREFPE
jgi:pilus assembly protein CpaB